ncbi:hypothetical protein [Rhizobium leguminosarum]
MGETAHWIVSAGRQRDAIATSGLLVLDVEIGEAARLDVDTPGGC